MGIQRKYCSRFSSSITFFTLFLAFAFQGCGKSPSSLPKAVVPSNVRGIDPPEELLRKIAEGQSGTTSLTNQALIEVVRLNNRLFYAIEATFTPEEFSRLKTTSNETLEKEIKKALKKLNQADAIDLKIVADWGYFSFLLPYESDLLAPLKTIHFESGIIFNPITVDRDALRDVKTFTPAAEGFDAPSMMENKNGNYSGLARIHTREFLKKAKESIGSPVVIDGSTVKLGITDTGITYNHPTFSSADGKKNRITYMKDFTREGRVYFNPTAKFEAKPSTSDDEIIISAETIKGLKLPSIPKANDFVLISETKFKVSSAIRETVLNPKNSVKLGYINEVDFQSDSGQVDINKNGTRDDQLAVLFVAGKEFPNDSMIYVDFSGTNDFTKSKALRDFNLSNDTAVVHAEKIGFDFNQENLPSKEAKSAIQVFSVSIVGFDPGNHGTHVAGIAAGKNILNNDSEGTLARGVAPGAEIFTSRVCSNNAGCSATQALVDFALNTEVQVINMSLGGLSPFNDGSGVQETLINRLTFYRNILFVISAGNSGPGRQTVGSPSTARLSLSVGASATPGMIQKQYQYRGSTFSEQSENDLDRDFMLFFSSRGPTASGGFKPNLTAPGTELSSVQLNTVPEALGGLAVYWGTSMAAPTVTGAYALLLDGINKYNRTHPSAPMTTDARELRRVLIETARPFDVSSYDPATGKKTEGQYTWADQGTGMLDLVAAWERLLTMSKNPLPTAITHDEKPIELDYQVLVSQKSPDGTRYDGSRLGDENTPIFGSGVYLDLQGTESLRKVHILRKLPEHLLNIPSTAELSRQLNTTHDEFVLRTTIYGSDQVWLKAGVLDLLPHKTPCRERPAGNLVVLGSGAKIGARTEKGTNVVALDASTLNICIDRRMIARELKPGDHGALISAYRKVGEKLATVASFTVPVFITVPHQSLADSKAYEISGAVNSFELNRNYIKVPVGTSVLMLTLEVPVIKRDSDGVIAENEHCSGIELMALEGRNTAKPFEKRSDSRIFNCTVSGSPSDDKRILKIFRPNPRAGVWDIHVFGSYQYERSIYKLRVDYLNSASSIAKIDGMINDLSGSFSWKIKDSSISVVPDPLKSSFELNSLLAESEHQIKKDETLIVPGIQGPIRTYPANVRKVTLTTNKSPGNDLDLFVLGCPKDATSLDDSRCRSIGKSAGPDDNEKVSFIPKTDLFYAMAVVGYAVKGIGKFTAVESLSLTAERGSLQMVSVDGESQVNYGFTPEQISSSSLLQAPLFTSGQYQVSGALVLKTAQEGVLDVIPVTIRRP